MERQHRTSNSHENMAQSNNGFLIILSAPSGAGKTTILKALLKKDISEFCYSISATTRLQRDQEVDGRDYYFISFDEFQRKIKNQEFIEYASVHGHFYGTPQKDIDNWIKKNKIILMDIDVQGGISVKQKMGNQAVLIFIKPPSLEILEKRLRARNTDSQEVIRKRLLAAKDELKVSKEYDHVVINRDIETTIREVLQIISIYHSGYIKS